MREKKTMTNQTYSERKNHFKTKWKKKKARQREGR